MRVDPETARDRALIVALQAGDAAAPPTLLSHYRDLVFALCYRMLGHRQDAEDVLQETFVRALRGIGGFDAARPLRPWLLGIAANRCRTALVRRRRRPVPLPGDELPLEAAPVPAIDPDLPAALAEAVARLRPEYQQVFTLFHSQGLPYDEIARRIGRPVGTVKTWLHRARLALAEELARRGYSA
jgi:RNA polymerase sigma-70 factor (ECF subfamily)